jgi:glycosyltransferase involved in cell wall biosynthesis
MRIGFDGTPLLGPRTGVGWYTAELVAALAAAAPGDERLVLPISWRTASQLELDIPNTSVVRRFMPARPLHLLWDRVPFPPLEWFLRCDVFHATNFLAPPTRRTPVVVTVHDLAFVHHPETCHPYVQSFAELLPPVLKRAAAVIAVSRFTADELAGWVPEVADRVTVVPNGGHARAPATTTGIDPGPPYVLLLGTLGVRKNLPLLLDAFVMLRGRGAELRLVLAGAPDPLVDVDALLTERRIVDDVTVTGYIDDGRAAALLEGAAALAFPSLYEGFGMPLVEAMDAGTPVVAVRSGATPETVGDAAVLVPPRDVEGFAAAIASVVEDGELRRRLIDAGRRRSTEFTWSRTAVETLAVYGRALA